MRFVIDRFEDKCAILECDDESEKVILRRELPIDAKEGDILEFIDGKYVINIEETQKVKANMLDKLKKFKRK